MTTPNTKSVKAAMERNGVKVLRAFIYNGRMILTIKEDGVATAEQLLSSMEIQQQFGNTVLPKRAKANILGYKQAAEFTCLVQLVYA